MSEQSHRYRKRSVQTLLTPSSVLRAAGSPGLQVKGHEELKLELSGPSDPLKGPDLLLQTNLLKVSEVIKN